MSAIGSVLHNELLSSIFWKHMPTEVAMCFPFTACLLAMTVLTLLCGADPFTKLSLWRTMRVGALNMGSALMWVGAVFVPSKLIVVNSSKDATAMLQLASQTSIAEVAMWVCIPLLNIVVYVSENMIFSDAPILLSIVVPLSGVVASLGAFTGLRSFRVQILKKFGERDGLARAQARDNLLMPSLFVNSVRVAPCVRAGLDFRILAVRPVLDHRDDA
jgi:hypothetical protein